MPLLVCCVVGVGLLVVGQSIRGFLGSFAELGGAGLIVGSIFIPGWRRAAAAASHDEQKRNKLAALNRRLFACLALAAVALAALALILRSFSSGDAGLLLGLIPLALLLIVLIIATFTAIAVRSLW